MELKLNLGFIQRLKLSKNMQFSADIYYFLIFIIPENTIKFW